MRYGFWTDLGTKNLFESAETSWVHALPIGSYDHPVYGKMDFTQEKVNDFALSVKTKVRGVDPDIDYDHKQDPAKGTKAAGWVKDAEVREDGLYLNVHWTEEGARALKAGEFRYFSPEFDDEWTDGAGTKHQNVIFGGALTNRPFLKDLMPVNLSEIITGGKVGPQPTPPTPAPSPPAPPAAPVALSEEAMAKLLAEHPTIKALVENQKTLTEKLAESERTRRLSEVKHRLTSLQATQGGRKYVLPPSVIDAIAEGTVTGDPVKMSEQFLGGIEALAKVGFVELGERGKMTGGARGNEVDSTTQLSQAVLQVRTSHQQTTGKTLSYRDAIAAVVRENPDLYEAYRAESYAGKED